MNYIVTQPEIIAYDGSNKTNVTRCPDGSPVNVE
jgi:hypothetical protein